MPIDFFGFSIGKKGKEPPKPTTAEIEKNKKLKSFVGPDEYDGSFSIESGGVFGTYVDFTGAIKSENDLIRRYRSMALFPEVDMAVTDICNDAIVMDEESEPITVNLDKVDISENIKTKIYDEFDEILRILNFNNKGYDIFRRWYVDSKLYYHIIIDNNNPKKGIQELRPIDPVQIQKIRKVDKEILSKDGVRMPVVKSVEEFFLYTNTDKNSLTPTPNSGLKIAPDAICYSHSGVVDTGTKRVVGYLQKAIRALNMLRQIEDAVVIYRISRAPERRIFYIDVGNLPKQKAEQYLRDIMNRYRNKIVYDSGTGEIRDDRRHMSMLEDFWLPRREGGRGTEISTLEGGQNLGEMEDVLYLQKKLYRSLNVPPSRLESENGFNMGRSAEITRDEVKFFKFIERLRSRFSTVFLQLLKTQLVLKGIMTQEDWDKIFTNISFSFRKDSYFTELKETEIMKERLEMLRDMDDYIGKYYSIEFVRKNILQQSEKDIEEIDDQIKKETEQGKIEGGEEEGEEEF
tara:strand:- start:881 stop:2431 length:1551 start_codon:yes stop_codon:yes gene_type:complete